MTPLERFRAAAWKALAQEKERLKKEKEEAEKNQDDKKKTPLERFRAAAWKALAQDKERIRKEKEAEWSKKFQEAKPLDRFRLAGKRIIADERKNKPKVVKQQDKVPELKGPPSRKASTASTFSTRKPSFKGLNLGKVNSMGESSLNEGWEPDEPPTLLPERKISGFSQAASAVTGTNKAANIFKERAKERIKMNATLKLKERMRALVQERLTVKQIFQKYVESSTLHGFVYTCSDTFFIRRFIWACLMLLGAIYFLLKLVEAINLFVEYPFSTLATLEYVDYVKLPAISFCLANQYRQSKLEQTSIKQLNDKNWLPVGSSWQYPGIDISGDQLVKDIEASSYTMDDIHSECDYIARDTDHPLIDKRYCGTDNFTKFFSQSGQLCYTLNSGKPGHPILGVQQEGLNNGYEIIFDLKNFDALRLVDYTGIQIRVHDQAEPPVSSSGFFITPGSRTIIRLDRSETENLPPPYGTECGEVELKYHDEYNQKACILEKETEFVEKECGCREPYMPDTGAPLCSVKELTDCAFPAKGKISNEELRSECPLNCEEINFFSSLSTSRFLHDPPKGAEQVLLEAAAERSGANTTYLLELKKKYNDTELDNYIEENIIVVLFYYGEMSIQVNTQEATFTFYEFLGDMGGEIGLMLGASLLTFVEFVDLLLFLLYHQLLRLQKRKLNKSEEKDAKKLKEKGEATEMEQLV